MRIKSLAGEFNDKQPANEGRGYGEHGVDTYPSKQRIASANRWTGAHYVPHQVSVLPASFTFTGSAIALIGTLGERCCEPGHARVLVDGTETFDRTGIWQSKSSSGRSLPDSVLFAWRWPRPGPHTLAFAPGAVNGKEGASFLHLRAYVILP